jgi:hypothetical protein
MRPRLACRRTGFVLLLGLMPLVEACLLFSPLDEVSDGTELDDDVGAGAYGGGTNGESGGAGNGGAPNTGSGGTSSPSGGGSTSPGNGGNIETGSGGNIGLSGSGGSGGNGGAAGGMGGSPGVPSDVSSWCPDPVALFAQNNPYIASFTFVSGDCPDPDDTEYRAGVEPAPNCTIMETSLSPEFCGYEEVETCIDLALDATTTADGVSRALVVQLEPGGPIVGSAELSFDFYVDGEFFFSCTGTYDVTYTPQFGQ